MGTSQDTRNRQFDPHQAWELSRESTAALRRMRHRIARDLHDEVEANLGSISLLTEVMEQRPQPDDLVRIRRLARETVETRRDLVWMINPAKAQRSKWSSVSRGLVIGKAASNEVKYPQATIKKECQRFGGRLCRCL